MESTVKVGVSIPRSLFEQAEELARHMKLSRSKLFSLALQSYIQRQQNRELLAQINAAYAEGLSEDERAFLQAASTEFSRIVEREPEDQW